MTATPWWKALRAGTVLHSPPITRADGSGLIVSNVNNPGVLWDPQRQVFQFAGRDVPPYQQARPALGGTITRSHKATMQKRGR
jgi:hypothetical protein